MVHTLHLGQVYACCGAQKYCGGTSRSNQGGVIPGVTCAPVNPQVLAGQSALIQRPLALTHASQYRAITRWAGGQ